MSVISCVSRAALAALLGLLETNPSVDWRVVVLDEAGLDALHWGELDRGAMVPLVRAYQRVLRILPRGEEHRALAMLGAGLHSAVQIADLPRDQFVRRWAELFPGDDALGIVVHRAAIGRRSELLLHHINEVQRNEPHYRAARFK